MVTNKISRQVGHAVTRQHATSPLLMGPLQLIQFITKRSQLPYVESEFKYRCNFFSTAVVLSATVVMHLLSDDIQVSPKGREVTPS